MTTPLYDDSNWREEYKQYTNNKRYLELLENGPKQLSQAWVLGALYNEWKKIKGYDKLDPVVNENEGQLQSSLADWEKSIEKYKKRNSNCLRKNYFKMHLKTISGQLIGLTRKKKRKKKKKEKDKKKYLNYIQKNE